MNDAIPPIPTVAAGPPHLDLGSTPQGGAGWPGGEGDLGGDLAPIDDPYLSGQRTPIDPPELSGLALTAIIAPIVPLIGGVAGIVFGWFACREIEVSGGKRRGVGLARAGMIVGVVCTMIWGAFLCFSVWTSHNGVAVPLAAADPVEPARAIPTAGQAIDPAPRSASAQGYVAPKVTATRRVAAITLVDVGVSATSLSEVLAQQRVEASNAGETMMVMTTAGRCEPCQGVEASLRDPLMQTALARVRMVRVDTTVFAEDLAALKIPAERIPGFFLLGVNLTPRDGLDGGEWDDDIAQNIAPVLGAFVRGKYTARREPWKALPGSGMRL